VVIPPHNKVASPGQRITGYNLRNFAELAPDATLQAHFRQYNEGASAAAVENRGMDQCVRTEHKDQFRYSGSRESLKSREHRGALLKLSLFNNAQMMSEPSALEALYAFVL
jgi:hypothetical protein